MRLTLRTLLAYLDDVLDPTSAKDIGQRIQENSAAMEQVERIRAVLRKRRIGAPEIAGPGSGPDPNIVAEYLDNTLTPEAIAELEKLCLDSDMHLAEAAASHQILSIVLGEPIEVPATLKERMYAVGHVTRSIETVPAADAARSGAVAAGAAAGAGVVAAGAPSSAARIEPQIPDYLRRKPWGSRITAGLLVALGLGWLVWVLNDQSLKPTVPSDALAQGDVPSPPAEPAPGETPAPAAPAPAVADGNLVPPVPDLNEPAPAVPPMGGTTAVVATAPIAKPSEMAAAPAPPVPATTPEPMPPVPVPATTPMPAPMPAATVPPAPMPGTVPAPPAPMPPVAPAVPPLKFADILYGSTDGVALLQQAGDWTVLPRRSVIHAQETIGVPEPFDATFQIEGGKLDLTAFGETAVRFSPSTPAVSFGVVISRGKVLITRTSVPADPPVKMQLTVAGRVYEVTFPEANTVVGLDVVPPQPFGRPADGMPLPVAGGLVVSRGSVTVQPAGGAAVAIRPDAGELTWMELAAGKAQGQLKALPAWMVPGGIKVTPTQKQFARSFEKEFALEQTVSQSIPAVSKSDIARMAEAAVRTLTLTGNYRELVRSLQSKHEEARIAAIIGLREWLAENPQNEVLLTEEVGRVFPDSDVPGVITLLWGFPPQAARDPQASRQIVDVLTHDDIAIRELGFFHLVTLTGKTYSYKPVLPKGQRDAAYARWEEHLKKVGALLPPEMQ